MIDQVLKGATYNRSRGETRQLGAPSAPCFASVVLSSSVCQLTGVYGSQTRDDYNADDVEQYFNYMGMLATEVNPDSVKFRAWISRSRAWSMCSRPRRLFTCSFCFKACCAACMPVQLCRYCSRTERCLSFLCRAVWTLVQGTYDRMDAMLGADIHPVDILLLWAAAENDTPKVAELLRAGADASAKVRIQHAPTLPI